MACVNITKASGYNDELSSLKISKSSNFCHVPDFTVSSGASEYEETRFPVNATELPIDGCDVSYACTDVVRTDGQRSSLGCDPRSDSAVGTGIYPRIKYGAGSGEFFYENHIGLDYAWAKIEPGEYEVTVTGTSSMGETKDATFSFELIDPCNPPDRL